MKMPLLHKFYYLKITTNNFYKVRQVVGWMLLVNALIIIPVATFRATNFAMDTWQQNKELEKANTEMDSQLQDRVRSCKNLLDDPFVKRIMKAR